MLAKLHLHDFKNYQSTSLPPGPFTILFGLNAVAKSNLRDALRFLHGIARGYTLADTIGENWGEGGVLQWRGLRGGTVEAVWQATRRARGVVCRAAWSKAEVLTAGEESEP